MTRYYPVQEHNGRPATYPLHFATIFISDYTVHIEIMRITFLLFASMAAATTLYCNGGTEGNGDCEKNKLHTYCVGLGDASS